MKKQKRNIEVILKPQDFVGNDYESNEDCALARAMKRHFKIKNVCVTPCWVELADSNFNIKDGFLPSDFDFVKEQYENDPKMKKARYVVTLIPD